MPFCVLFGKHLNAHQRYGMGLQSAKLIHQFLEESAHQFPDKTALVHGSIRETYAQINGAANHVATWCLDQGVIHGDRVVLLMENSLEYVVSYYGVLKTGAVVVALNSKSKPDDIRSIFERVGPKLVIVSSACERIFRAANLTQNHVHACLLRHPSFDWDHAPVAVHAWEDVVSSADQPNVDCEIDPSQLSSIIFTSGSTGHPKGVMLSHANIVANVQSICQYLTLRPKDIQMVVLPFTYVMGTSLLNTHFAVGGTVVINNAFAYPASVVAEMAKEEVTGFSGVPSTYAYLLHRSPLQAYRDRLGALRYCSQAGGHMSKHIKQQLLNVLPTHTKLIVMYGATEASARLTYLHPDHLIDKIDSIGKPIAGVTLRVLDSSGHLLPRQKVGELVASGANIMQGYWNDPVGTSRVLDEDGYHTGDLGFQDEDGFFYVTHRIDNLLKVGGHRINPQGVEDAIMETGLIVETIVLGIEDRLQGHKLVALAVSKDQDLTDQDLLRQCIKRLPRHSLPSQIRLVRTLPKNSAGKIDTNACRALLE